MKFHTPVIRKRVNIAKLFENGNVHELWTSSALAVQLARTGFLYRSIFSVFRITYDFRISGSNRISENYAFATSTEPFSGKKPCQPILSLQVNRYR